MAKTSPSKKSSKKAATGSQRAPAPAAPASFRTPTVARNGLRSFAFHRDDKGGAQVLGAIRPKVAAPSPRTRSAAAPAPGAGPRSFRALDAETVARHYLANALASDRLPTFTAGDAGGEKSDFKLIAVEAVPLTGTQVVKFSQHYRRTPVYGSLVTIELDKNNDLVSINSALTEPTDVDPVASVAPAEALRTVARSSGSDVKELKVTPGLYYYFDRDEQRWRLVYIARDVRKLEGGDRAERHARSPRTPQVFDYVVDAHSGELVVELPRSHSISVRALDGLKKLRTIVCSKNSSGRILHDPALNLHTHDFGFRNVDAHASKLPGDYVCSPPEPWDAAAVSAHANASDVLKFFRTVLRRNGVDNMGGPVRSSIHCVEESGTREWDNAVWDRNQMMYGQTKVDGTLRSWALGKDIVAHELTHGITDATARIEYLGESGALNESYSDILGVIVANIGKTDVKRWNWLIGSDILGREDALRSMKNPEERDQPSHMDRYQKLPKTEAGDWGGVHVNSGIHNKAAYNMLTARNARGVPLLKPREVAALFYLALTQNLSRTSRFADSRRGVELAARSLFAKKSDKLARLKAIGKAFDKVGIV
jgi:Zn-dependent metalloprotease